MKKSIKIILGKVTICKFFFCLFLLQACKPERTTDYKIENKAEAAIQIYTKNSDSIYSVASGTSQTIFTTTEFVGKDNTVSEKFLLAIDSIKKADLKYKYLLKDSTWTKTSNSKNTQVTYKIGVQNSDF